MQFRYAFELAYNGFTFNGWQRQPNAPSVQEELELALQKLFSGETIQVVGCGRTDTGVHASYYVMHADFSREIDEEQFAYKLNKMLSDDVAIFSIQRVTEEFHARFSATNRTYHYFIHTSKNPFVKNSLYLPHNLNLEAMNKGAEALLGKQDFTSLSKLHTDVKTNICEVKKAFWTKTSSGYCFEIQADRFLRNMVRATVGTLLEIGLGKAPIDHMALVLNSMDRSSAGKSVPSHGLFLVDVIYPKDIFHRYVV